MVTVAIRGEFSHGFVSSPPTPAIPIPSARKQAKLSMPIPEPASSGSSVLATLAEMTVFTNERPPNVRIIEHVISQGARSV
ncbi:hypothetical protein D3C72_2420670 [compost metagenome]